VVNDESPRGGASKGSRAAGAEISCTGVEAWRLSSPPARAADVIEEGSETCTEEEGGAAPPWEEAIPGEQFPGGVGLGAGMCGRAPSSLGGEQFPQSFLAQHLYALGGCPRFEECWQAHPKDGSKFVLNMIYVLSETSDKASGHLDVGAGEVYSEGGLCVFAEEEN